MLGCVLCAGRAVVGAHARELPALASQLLDKETPRGVRFVSPFLLALSVPECKWVRVKKARVLYMNPNPSTTQVNTPPHTSPNPTPHYHPTPPPCAPAGSQIKELIERVSGRGARVAAAGQ